MSRTALSLLPPTLNGQADPTPTPAADPLLIYSGELTKLRAAMEAAAAAVDRAERELEKRVCQSSVARDNPPLLVDQVELARLLAVHLNTLARMEAVGDLGPERMQFGKDKKAVRFRFAEVQCWVAAGCPPRDRWTWPAKK